MNTVSDLNYGWKLAAKRYEIFARKEEKTSVTKVVSEVSEHTKEEIENAVRRLNDFFSFQGAAATILLRESRRHVILGENRCGGGMTEVFYIDASGLHRSVEASGTWAAYNSNVPRPKISDITPDQAVLAAVVYGGMKPFEIVDNLIRELNKIAEAAPQ